MRSLRLANQASKSFSRHSLVCRGPLIHLTGLHKQANPSSTVHASSQTDRDFESKKLAQDDRNKIDGQTTEYSQSGTDNAVAAQNISFEPSQSKDPRDAISNAGGPSTLSNPLEVSPADPDLSTTTSEAQTAIDQKTTMSQSRTYYGPSGKSKTTVSTIEKKKVHKGFDRRKPGQSPTIIKPGSR